MRRFSNKLFQSGLMFLAACILSAGSQASRTEAGSVADRTLSPYFFVQNGDPELDRLPLKATEAEVDIAGVIADVRVRQIYENQGHQPIEAVYVFPASTRAAVYGMRMTIGERTIVADVREREQARKDYEQARDAGQSASLLEQQRPNVFQMNVANILPGEVIEVELRYTELLVPEGGVYEFVYPTVVGPRYSNESADSVPPSEHWVENPYLHEGETAPYTFDISARIAAGMVIQDLTCPSHQVQTKFRSQSLASVTLDTSEAYGGNRDFILKYRLAGGKVVSGLLLYEGEEENFFLFTVQPPKRIRPAQIPPREYIFIVDVSGSMNGFPLDISKKLLKDLIGHLRPSDTFNVLLFAGSSSLFSEKSLPASRENIAQAVGFIESSAGAAGRSCWPALKRALALPKGEHASRTVVIATDGYVTVEEEAFELIRSRLGEANMFAFGIGSSVNRHLIEGMARMGMGEPFVITKPDEAPDRAEKFRRIIESPVLTQIKVDFGDFDVYDVEPPAVPDVLSERPVMVFGKYRGRPRGTLTLEGITGEGEYRHTVKVKKVRALPSNSALRYLWARHRIAVLGDFNRLNQDDERVREITSLGLTYNLLTAYTSFVAIDSRVRTSGGDTVTIKQPLPLPQGVSDYAVGGKGYRVCAAPSTEHMCQTSLSEVKLREKTDKDEALHSESGASNAGEEEACGEIRISLENVSIRGTASRIMVEAVLQRHMSRIWACFKASGIDPAVVKGKMIIEFQINGKGQVERIHAIRFEPQKGRHDLSGIRKSVRKEVWTLNFPGSHGGSSSSVTAVFSIH